MPQSLYLLFALYVSNVWITARTRVVLSSIRPNQHGLSERWKLRLPPCIRAMALTTSPILNRIGVMHSPVCHNRFLRLEYPDALLLSPSFFYRTCNIRLKLETKLENYFLKHSYHGIIMFLARVLQNKHAIFVFTATLMNSTHLGA